MESEDLFFSLHLQFQTKMKNMMIELGSCFLFMLSKGGGASFVCVKKEGVYQKVYNPWSSLMIKMGWCFSIKNKIKLDYNGNGNETMVYRKVRVENKQNCI